jgi:hypothetical protein
MTWLLQRSNQALQPTAGRRDDQPRNATEPNAEPRRSNPQRKRDESSPDVNAQREKRKATEITGGLRA